MIAAILEYVIQAIINAFLNRPTNPVTEGEKAGAAQQQATDLGAQNEEVAKAAAAGTGLGPVLNNPDKLRDLEAKDPNNRDN